MGSAWNNQWSVGNAIIDSEHRNLLMKPMLQTHAYSFLPDHKTKPEAHLATLAWNNRFNMHA